MRTEVSTEALSGLDAGLVVLPLAHGSSLPEEARDAAGSGDVDTRYRKQCLLRPGRPSRLLVVGLGKPEEVDAERLRVAAALGAKRAARYGATSIALVVPEAGPGPETAGAALVEGAVLGSYRFDRFKSRDPEDPPPPPPERVVVARPGANAAEGLEDSARSALVAALAENRARDLQALPANLATPSYLVERAREIADASDAVDLEVLRRREIIERGLGGLASVSQGTAEEPALIALRYSGGGGGDTVGLVGKAVTFDTGGISIKPAGSMHEMKMDMSGGAAVLEAFAAIAELGLPLELVAVVPATENMPSGTATRPGDVITQLNGKTVEVNNTDAEGRLILADALTWCVREMGANRLIDVATLTGAVLVALGSTYAALISNDDVWADRIRTAAEGSGELAWRLPLHPEYKELTRGKVADLTNAAAKRKAGTIYAGSFLEEFVDGVPWAHLDIAGTAWDVGREYVGDGPTGFGTRLLIRLARDLAASAS